MLTAPQRDRLAAVGVKRDTREGEILVNVGDRHASLFVVLDGAVDVVRPSDGTIIVTHRAGQFSGETNLLTGRPAVAQLRVATPGTVVEVDREHVQGLVQADVDVGQVLLRAFLLRHLEIIAGGYGDAVVIGSRHSADTLRVNEFLTRNGLPFQYLDLDRDADAQTMLDRFHVGENDVPVLVCMGRTVLRNPTEAEVADCLGLNEAIDESHVNDVAVVGAGPAGLAAAVYAASEGLDVLVLESHSPGGQAGTSSRIENYLGFPTGISGLELTGRAYAQAQKFGARVMIARTATRLARDGHLSKIVMDNGSSIRAKAVVIATGVQYRKPALDNLARFEGAGVYYAATTIESQLCVGEEVAVVGGGNSAGQAAVFLAQTARRVHIFVRRDGLAETMSRYLIRRIEESPTIELHTEAEIVGVDGDSRLESIRWRDNRSGRVDVLPIGHVFMMTGAVPNTRWLANCILLDDKGFVRTGSDLTRTDLDAANWPLARPPYLLETSIPGIFAVGDVRCGNIKRVASAVGEGSMGISFVHRVLQGG